MIGWLSGEVIQTFSGGIILNVNGVGYRIFTPLFAWKIGDKHDLFIHHHIREDQSNLYGFGTREELELFELLLTVSGVGPKLAMTILSSSSVQAVAEAIEKGRPEILQSIPGVGAKAAAKIVVELKKKVSGGALDIANFGQKSDIVEALVNLGISRQEIGAVLKDLPSDIVDESEQIKWILKKIRR